MNLPITRELVTVVKLFDMGKNRRALGTRERAVIIARLCIPYLFKCTTGLFLVNTLPKNQGQPVITTQAHFT